MGGHQYFGDLAPRGWMSSVDYKKAKREERASYTKIETKKHKKPEIGLKNTFNTTRRDK